MRTLILLSLTLAAGGCSQAPSASVRNAAASAAAEPVPTPVHAPGSPPAPTVVAPCDYAPVGPADVQPLLTGPITEVKPAPSDPASCVFSTASFSSVSVTMRADGGRQTLQQWHKGPVTPVSGVGDDAVWEPDLKEIVASHGDALCTVTAMGPEVTPVTAQTEGALCRKVFEGR